MVVAAAAVVVARPAEEFLSRKGCKVMNTKRQGLIVWFQHMKNLRQIKRYGHLLYASKKMRYAVLYVNSDEIADVELRLQKLSFISKTDRSSKPFINTTYENAIPDKAKQYDYKF